MADAIFVYGTLRRGAENHALVAHARRAEPARARGRIFWLPAGYPALVPGEGEGAGAVEGELLEFDGAVLDATLRALDAFEGEGELYLRREIEVETASGRRIVAWAYVNDMEMVRAAGARPVEGAA